MDLYNSGIKDFPIIIVLTNLAGAAMPTSNEMNGYLKKSDSRVLLYKMSHPSIFAVNNTLTEIMCL